MKNLNESVNDSDNIYLEGSWLDVALSTYAFPPPKKNSKLAKEIARLIAEAKSGTNFPNNQSEK